MTHKAFYLLPKCRMERFFVYIRNRLFQKSKIWRWLQTLPTPNGRWKKEKSDRMWNSCTILLLCSCAYHCYVETPLKHSLNRPENQYCVAVNQEFLCVRTYSLTMRVSKLTMLKLARVARNNFALCFSKLHSMFSYICDISVETLSFCVLIKQVSYP